MIGRLGVGMKVRSTLFEPATGLLEEKKRVVAMLRVYLNLNAYVKEIMKLNQLLAGKNKSTIKADADQATLFLNNMLISVHNLSKEDVVPHLTHLAKEISDVGGADCLKEAGELYDELFSGNQENSNKVDQFVVEALKTNSKYQFAFDKQTQAIDILVMLARSNAIQTLKQLYDAIPEPLGLPQKTFLIEAHGTMVLSHALLSHNHDVANWVLGKIVDVNVCHPMKDASGERQFYHYMPPLTSAIIGVLAILMPNSDELKTKDEHSKKMPFDLYANSELDLDNLIAQHAIINELLTKGADPDLKSYEMNPNSQYKITYNGRSARMMAVQFKKELMAVNDLPPKLKALALTALDSVVTASKCVKEENKAGITYAT